MNIDTRDNIAKWSNITNEITCQFLYDYFDDVDPYYFWVGEEIGGVLNYGDYWFNFSDILICYKLDITEEQLFSWYDFCMESQKVNISLAKYVLSPEKRKEKEQEYLQELKQRVIFAEETLKKAIEEYENT